MATTNKTRFLHFCEAKEASLSLPPEVMLSIFSQLPPESVGSLLLVCRDWNALVSCPGSWTVWREWTRQTLPEAYDEAHRREEATRKAGPCWRSLYVSHKRVQSAAKRQQRKRQEEAAMLEKQQQQKKLELLSSGVSHERLMFASISCTSMALSNERKAWKQMLTVVSLSSLTTFAFFASMSLAY